MHRDATAEVADLLPELQALRHHLHAHPELAFQEHATSDIVADRLTLWGYDVTRGVGGTGLVATLACGDGTRRIGIRADMDALPITEATGLPYASRRAGVMHACGHDGHTAMLLGAAWQLARTRRFSGVLHLVFQPAEEKGHDSGAKAMLADGLFERFPCDRIFAIHNHPGAPVGTFLSRPGPLMATGNTVRIRVTGQGGHAARPHQSVDPVVAGAAIVMALQTVVSRNVDPVDSAVVTVGSFQAGRAANVIPGSAELALSVRCFSEGMRDFLRERITAIATMTAQAHGAQAEIDWVNGYPVVDNDAACTRFALETAVELFGEAAVLPPPPPMMGSEDFAYLLQACPGALIRLGNGPAEGGRGLHNAHYDFDDGNLAIGAAFWTRLVERYLTGERRRPPGGQKSQPGV